LNIYFLFIAPKMKRELRIRNCSVLLSDNIKILGVTLDCHLSLDKHISSICKSAYYHIWSLRHIRSAIIDDMAKSVASSLVCSRLDYANFLFLAPLGKISTVFSASKIHLPELLPVTLSISRGTRSLDILQDLHWLLIDERIEFKHATLTYSILNSSQPACLRSLLNYHTPTRSLRSANGDAEIARPDIARLDNVRPCSKGGHRET